MLPVGKEGRGKVNFLNIASVGFLVISLVSIVAFTTNPLKNLLIDTFAKSKKFQDVKPNNQSQAQQNADSAIRRAEKATQGGCVGAGCDIATLIKNQANSGTKNGTVTNPSPQQLAEQKLIDNYNNALKGDKTALDTLKTQNADLAKQVQATLDNQKATTQTDQVNKILSQCNADNDRGQYLCGSPSNPSLPNVIDVPNISGLNDYLQAKQAEANQLMARIQYNYQNDKNFYSNEQVTQYIDTLKHDLDQKVITQEQYDSISKFDPRAKSNLSPSDYRQVAESSASNQQIANVQIECKKSGAAGCDTATGLEKYSLSVLLGLGDPAYNEAVTKFNQNQKDLANLQRPAPNLPGVTGGEQKFGVVIPPSPERVQQALNNNPLAQSALARFRQYSGNITYTPAEISAVAKFCQDSGGDFATCGNVQTFSRNYLGINPVTAVNPQTRQQVQIPAPNLSAQVPSNEIPAIAAGIPVGYKPSLATNGTNNYAICHGDGDCNANLTSIYKTFSIVPGFKNYVSAYSPEKVNYVLGPFYIPTTQQFTSSVQTGSTLTAIGSLGANLGLGAGALIGGESLLSVGSQVLTLSLATQAQYSTGQALVSCTTDIGSAQCKQDALLAGLSWANVETADVVLNLVAKQTLVGVQAARLANIAITVPNVIFSGAQTYQACSSGNTLGCGLGIGLTAFMAGAGGFQIADFRTNLSPAAVSAPDVIANGPQLAANTPDIIDAVPGGNGVFTVPQNAAPTAGLTPAAQVINDIQSTLIQTTTNPDILLAQQVGQLSTAELAQLASLEARNTPLGNVENVIPGIRAATQEELAALKAKFENGALANESSVKLTKANGTVVNLDDVNSIAARDSALSLPKAPRAVQDSLVDNQKLGRALAEAKPTTEVPVLKLTETQTTYEPINLRPGKPTSLNGRGTTTFDIPSENNVKLVADYESGKVYIQNQSRTANVAVNNSPVQLNGVTELKSGEEFLVNGQRIRLAAGDVNSGTPIKLYSVKIAEVPITLPQPPAPEEILGPSEVPALKTGSALTGQVQSDQAQLLADTGLPNPKLITQDPIAYRAALQKVADANGLSLRLSPNPTENGLRSAAADLETQMMARYESFTPLSVAEYKAGLASTDLSKVPPGSFPQAPADSIAVLRAEFTFKEPTNEEIATLRQRLANLQDELSKAKFVDPATGLLNKPGGDEALATVINAAKGNGEPVTVIGIDISGLKQINDTFGHTAGDKLIKDAADIFTSTARRSSDIVIRQGTEEPKQIAVVHSHGDEFGLVFPGTDENGAKVIIQRMQDELKARQAAAPGNDIIQKLDFDSGIAEWNRTETPGELLDRADAAMYANKVARKTAQAVALIPAQETPLGPVQQAVGWVRKQLNLPENPITIQVNDQGGGHYFLTDYPEFKILKDPTTNAVTIDYGIPLPNRPLTETLVSGRELNMPDGGIIKFTGLDNSGVPQFQKVLPPGSKPTLVQQIDNLIPRIGNFSLNAANGAFIRISKVYGLSQTRFSQTVINGAVILSNVLAPAHYGNITQEIIDYCGTHPITCAVNFDKAFGTNFAEAQLEKFLTGSPPAPQEAPAPAIVPPISVSNFDQLNTGPAYDLTTTSKLTGYYTGERMEELLNFYKSQPGSWWMKQTNGDFGAGQLLAAQLIAEATGQPGPGGVSVELLRVQMEAAKHQLWDLDNPYAQALTGHPRYCYTLDCQGGGGVLNYVRGLEVARRRYDSYVAAHPGQSTIDKLAKDSYVADLFAAQGYTLDRIARELLENPNPIEWNKDVPSGWGNGEGWMFKAGNDNSTRGTTSDNGIVFAGQGDIVYTDGQKEWWENARLNKKTGIYKSTVPHDPSSANPVTVPAPIEGVTPQNPLVPSGPVPGANTNLTNIPITPINEPQYLSQNSEGAVFYTNNYRPIPKKNFLDEYIAPQGIVLHWDENPYDPVTQSDLFTTNLTYKALIERKTSVHFAVDPQGVTQFMPMGADTITQAYGNSGLGPDINIEFVGIDFDKKLPPQAEIDNAVDLVTRLVIQYKLDIGSITHHINQDDVNPEFVELIKGLVRARIAQMSSQSPSIAPSGFLGILPASIANAIGAPIAAIWTWPGLAAQISTWLQPGSIQYGIDVVRNSLIRLFARPVSPPQPPAAPVAGPEKFDPSQGSVASLNDIRSSITGELGVTKTQQIEADALRFLTENRAKTLSQDEDPRMNVIANYIAFSRKYGLLELKSGNDAQELGQVMSTLGKRSADIASLKPYFDRAYSGIDALAEQTPGVIVSDPSEFDPELENIILVDTQTMQKIRGANRAAAFYASNYDLFVVNRDVLESTIDLTAKQVTQYIADHELNHQNNQFQEGQLRKAVQDHYGNNPPVNWDRLIKEGHNELLTYNTNLARARRLGISPTYLTTTDFEDTIYAPYSASFKVWNEDIRAALQAKGFSSAEATSLMLGVKGYTPLINALGSWDNLFSHFDKLEGAAKALNKVPNTPIVETQPPAAPQDLSKVTTAPDDNISTLLSGKPTTLYYRLEHANDLVTIQQSNNFIGRWNYDVSGKTYHLMFFSVSPTNTVTPESTYIKVDGLKIYDARSGKAFGSLFEMAKSLMLEGYDGLIQESNSLIANSSAELVIFDPTKLNLANNLHPLSEIGTPSPPPAAPAAKPNGLIGFGPAQLFENWSQKYIPNYNAILASGKGVTPSEVVQGIRNWLRGSQPSSPISPPLAPTEPVIPTTQKIETIINKVNTQIVEDIKNSVVPGYTPEYGCMAGLCGLASDYAAIAAPLYGLDPTEYQVQDLNVARGLTTQNSFRHAMTVVKDSAGDLYLIDNTFIQFADPFTGNIRQLGSARTDGVDVVTGLTRDNLVVKELLTKGYIKLTPNILNEYLRITSAGPTQPSTDLGILSTKTSKFTANFTSEQIAKLTPELLPTQPSTALAGQGGPSQGVIENIANSTNEALTAVENWASDSIVNLEKLLGMPIIQFGELANATPQGPPSLGQIITSLVSEATKYIQQPVNVYASLAATGVITGVFAVTTLFHIYTPLNSALLTNCANRPACAYVINAISSSSYKGADFVPINAPQYQYPSSQTAPIRVSIQPVNNLNVVLPANPAAVTTSPILSSDLSSKPVDCTAHCDGTRVFELYSWYKAQLTEWWYHNGQFTPTDFAAMIVMGEAQGSSNPETVQATVVKIAEAISNQLSYSSPENGRPGYCITSDCQRGAGILNFLGAYSQSAWVRYKSLSNNPSEKNLNGLRDQDMANYYSEKGLSLRDIANSIVHKPATYRSDYIDLPTEWGCRGCSDPGLTKWVEIAIAHNAPTGVTDPKGVYYLGKDGEVVYTLNQAYYWTHYGGK